MKTLHYTCLLIMITTFLSVADVTITPVNNFDLNKYAGVWYEIARMPSGFEKNLVNVSANYQIVNGKVKVINSGYRDGKISKIVGKAKFASSKTTLGALKVSFFGPFYSNYVIIDLDSSYTYAMVASSKKHLWILSRQKVLDKSIIDRLVKKAQALGFNVNELYFTPQI